MNITYYTVASTRCMGIWRDEGIVGQSNDTSALKEYFNGFETREAAEAFVRNYPTILEKKENGRIRNVKLEQEANGDFRLSYNCLCGWGETRRWKETHFRLKVNEHTFSLVPRSQDVLTLSLK